MVQGLYIHVPFCVRKCHYCDFNSYPWQAELVEAYLRALKQEIRLYAQKPRLAAEAFETIFIGGGTPSCLEAGQLAEILETCRASFSFAANPEITLEANPGTFDRRKLRLWKEAGVNRLSLGIQALQEDLLKRLGRVHGAQECFAQFALARDEGFDNINLDLMFGLPGQTLEVWRETCRQIAELRPDHLAAYQLKVEEGTPFYRELQDGSLLLPDEETELAMYETAMEVFAGAGYGHYEISNFALPGKQCRHNLIYWHNDEYLGLGPGAYSYLDRYRYANLADQAAYANALSAGNLPVAGGEHLDRATEMAETVILALRLREGLNFSRFRQRFGEDFLTVFGRQVTKLVEQDLLNMDGSGVRLTYRGLCIANRVFMEFLP